MYKKYRLFLRNILDLREKYRYFKFVTVSISYKIVEIVIVISTHLLSQYLSTKVFTYNKKQRAQTPNSKQTNNKSNNLREPAQTNVAHWNTSQKSI